MTNGILKSINTKDKQYKELILTKHDDELPFNRLKTDFNTYRATLRRSIREGKLLYTNFQYIQKRHTKKLSVINIYKKGICNTVQIKHNDMVNNTLNGNRGKQTFNRFIITDQEITDPNLIDTNFNKYSIISVDH